LRKKADSEDNGHAVLARIAEFHDPEPESDFAHELSLVIAKLRLNAVDEELKLLFDSGVQSPDALRRSRELMEARKRLKT
jgi:DNA primase